MNPTPTQSAPPARSRDIPGSRGPETDPFACGLPRAVSLRLLAGPGRFTAADLRLYVRTDHWQAKKGEALAAAGYSCSLCDSPIGIQVHHRPSGYRALFREDARLHLVVLCSRHHKRFHGK